MTPVAAKTTFSPEASSSVRVDPGRVAVAHPLRPLALGVGAEDEAGLDLAAEAAQGGRREHALGRAADPHDGVDAGAGDGARDRRREVAVADQLDPGAGRADLGDERLVARPLQDDDRDVVDAAAQGRRDPAQVLRRRRGDVHLARHHGPDAELLHVAVGGVQEPAPLGRREDRDRARLAVGDEVRPLQRVDRDVDLGRLADGARRIADALADVEHRGLVALALADDDPGVDRDLVEGAPHRLHGEPVGVHRVAAPHQAGRRDRGGLGDADQLQGEQAFHWSDPPGGRRMRRRRGRARL